MSKLWAKYWWFNVILICFSPILVIFLGERPPFRDLWLEVSVFIGFIALSLLFLQFLITARIRSIAKEHGIDLVLQAHKNITWIVLGLILLHPIILFLNNPSLLWILNPALMPLRTLYGLLSVLCFFGLAFLSYFRKAIYLPYEGWRITHGLLAILIVIFAAFHVIEVHYYLSLIWKRVIWSAFAAGVVILLGYVRLIKPLILLHKPWRVSKVESMGASCWTLHVEPVGHKGFSFHPGQFAWIKLGTSPLFIGDNPFTISSSAKKRGKISFTIKELGDFTKKIKEIEKNTEAYIDGPYGRFSIDYYPYCRNFVMIAGGIGITPMMSMLRTMSDKKDKRKVQLFHGVNKEEELIFHEEIEKMTKHLDLHAIYVLKEKSSKISSSIEGVISKELLHEHIVDKNAEYFLCGPPKMNHSMKKHLKDLGVHRKNIHIERFDLV